ncbi:MAG: FmdB family zinc ribbon protein [Steroidobacteraceae bacterium]
MPFYEYECGTCKFYSEVMQKISEAPLRKCPSCGKNTFKRLISAPVFRLKGSGWYETDFKSDKEAKRNLAGEDKDAPAAKDDSKGESKPEAKADTKAETKSDAKSDSKPAAKSSSKPRTPAKSKPAPRRAAPARKK